MSLLTEICPPDVWGHSTKKIDVEFSGTERLVLCETPLSANPFSCLRLLIVSLGPDLIFFSLLLWISFLARHVFLF